MTMPTIIAEIGFAGPDATAYMTLDDPVRGLLDTGLLAGDDVMVEVTADLLSFTTRRGATRSDGPVLRYEAGTATVVLGVTDRRYDPTNLDGPYVTAGQTQVEPMRPVRLRATWNDVTYAVWTGYADTFITTYEDPLWVEVTIPATDAFKVLQSYDRAAVAPVGASEDTGARIDRILDSVAWPAAARDIDTGQSTLQETDLSGVALSELQLAAETEIGELYVDADGDVFFRGRDGVMTETRSVDSQATFGDDVGELPYDVSPAVEYDDKQLANLVRITRAGGAEQSTDDTDSIARYLTRTYNRTGLLMETDADAAEYAGFVLHHGRAPELRFPTIEINPLDDPDNLWPEVLGRRIGDRITVIRRPPGGGDPIERDCFIRGIEHTYGGETWHTRFVLQSATRWSYLVLDNEVLGVLDANALGY